MTPRTRQALIDSGRSTVLPSTWRQLATRNLALRAAPLLTRLHLGGTDRTAGVVNSLELPVMDAAVTAAEG
ncbi:MAG TPA: hypothetical protein VGE11_13105 [Pseudonocardia sp.]